MTTKYQLITNLYESTINNVTSSPDAWTAFLRSACRNYKCRFDEQILIYAQRPDATAVLEIERWNKLFGRWVNRGATGIAVFDDEHNGNYRLKHYFDISDTHESRFARNPGVWSMKPEYETEVIENLENSFGELDDKSTVAKALISVAKNVVDDNLTDYFDELLENREYSDLAKWDASDVAFAFYTVLKASVMYMLLTRCGLNTEDYFDIGDFYNIAAFNTVTTANTLGIATSDIAEMCLREISVTVRSLQYHNEGINRTFAEPENEEHNIINRQNDERGAENGRSIDISDGGGLQPAEPNRAGGRASSPWQVRVTSEKISETTPPRPVPELSDNGQAERTFDGDRTDGERAYGTDGVADGGSRSRDRADESREPNAVGGLDEQHPTFGGGNDTERSDIRIKSLPTVAQQQSIFNEAEEERGIDPHPPLFSISQQIIDEVLTSGGNEPDSTLRIVAYFKKDHTAAENTDFLRREYRTGGKGFMFGGNRVSVWFDENGIRATVGDTVHITDASLITWDQAARRTREMLDMGRYMPQSELDKVDGFEIKRLADELWYTHQDLDGYEFSFMDADIFSGGFPDSTARIAELLAQPEQRNIILDGLREFAAAFEQNPSLLRFRFSADYLRSALNGISDLEREPLVFTADESVSSARPSFITQDELDSVIMRGGSIQDGKFRIYSYFLHDHTSKEKADFLKHEYGMGGSSRKGFSENHDSNGIAYSRENNHMPYDKVIMPWPKVAKRIDELIAQGRYMSQRELEYIPEYEKGILSTEIYHFYYNQPEEVIRPYPYALYVTDAIKIIRPQLDQPKRVAEILAQMQAILDNKEPDEQGRHVLEGLDGSTASESAGSAQRNFRDADFDRHYQSMRKAFDNLTAYQNGAFTLFPPRAETTVAPVKPTEQPRARMTAAAQSIPSERSADEAILYDLRLGATVYLGIEEYEIHSFDDNLVVVRDVNVPLFTRGMPRTEFDRKLRENRLNDGLIRAVAPEPEATPAETPRVLYRKYLPILLEEIRKGDLYPFLRERDTDPLTAETEIRKALDSLAESIGKDDPTFYEAYNDAPQFRDWLAEDILDRTYQDFTADERDSVAQMEGDADAPKWAKRPELQEQIREELSLRGYAVSDELITDGMDEYKLRNGEGRVSEITAFIVNEYLTEEAESYTPKCGDRYEIQGRFFVVDKVDTDWETVSLRDVTFENSTGFPIFRSESLEFIRMYDPIQPEAQTIQHSEPVSEEIEDVNLKSIVIDLSPSQPEPKSEPSLTPSWEKPKPRSRTQTFDAFPDVPMSERSNYRITDDNLGTGGAKTKYHNNVEAIRTLQTIEAENRLATPAEQEILSRYVGWGGLADAFDKDKQAWANEYLELQSLLTPEEYKSARASTVNAYYTSPTVIKAIYKAVENMGFKTGNVLEPSCGIGNFFGLLPESMKDSKLFGIELDSLTGRIAQQLYQNNSVAIRGYENTNLPDSFFDLAIGNVPFGNYPVIDKRYDKHKFSIHDYFFAKTLDKVRPGGVIAFVTSKFMMDAKNPAVRKYIAQRADLLGAIRLPNNAFLKNAGTEVTADIIFLQKCDRIIDIEPEWIHLGETADGIPINSYFAEHPDMMLGTMSNDNGVRMYGTLNSTSCVPFPDSDLSEQLADAITNIHAEISEYERGEDEPEEDNSIPADPTVRNFSYTLVDGKVYYRQDSRMVPVELPVTTQNRVKGMIALRECVRDLIMYQTDGYPDSDIKAEQSKLNRLYDGFVRKYGLINSRGNSIAFSQDSGYCLLCSLEVIDENGELERKADMFHKRTIKPHEPVTHVDTAVEALAVSMSEKACVDLPYMSELSGMSEETLVTELDDVIFLNIGNTTDQIKTYVTADEYLSGNVREKLALAQAAQKAFPDGRYDTNVSRLKVALPKDLTAAEISVRLGATWLPEDVVQQFMVELLQQSYYVRNRIKVHYSQHTGEWNIAEKNADRSNIHSFNTYGTQRMNAYKIIEESLNLRDVRVFDKVYDLDGTEKRILNKKETAIAQAKQELIKTKFEEWIWKDPTRRERLCRMYNDKFNSIRPREYDGSHIKFVGMNPEISLRKHQIDAIAHIMYGGNTLLAHEVGAGKTYEMVAAAMESKRLGLCSKSLIVVPNHIIEQWAGEFLQLYPSANIFVATKKDFETKNRKKFCARIATGDYDAVIIGHSQFEKIPMSVERQQTMLRRQIDELVDGIDEVKRNRGERYTIKQMEKAKKNLEVKLTKLNDQSRKDDVVTFEELGIDRLFIDESHYFKNLFLITKMRNVAGITQTEAQKSSDLFMKTQYLDELTGGRGAIFATGTPISNSMVELYTIQRYLQYNLLVKSGLQHFDAWASTFGETVTAIELAPEGTGYRAKTRFAKFFNLPELMSMFRMVADIQTADMLNLPVPKANFHTEVIKTSQWQQDMVAELATRAERIRAREVPSNIDNMLKVTNDGRKLALDQRLMNEMLPDDPESKVSTCANNVYRIWEETKEKRLTQLVFSDLSTPHGDGKFNVYDDMKTKLIAKGVPEHEIAFIHNADTEAKKKELFAKVRKGQVRVLMGSTQKMGAGTNVQDRLIALNDLDCRATRSQLKRLRTKSLYKGIA